MLVDNEDTTVLPHKVDMNTKLVANQLNHCGCKAKQSRKLYLSESMSDLRARAIDVRDALLDAWSNKNTDLTVDRFNIITDLTKQTRRKRSAIHGNTTYKDDQGL